jgi:putative endonuclease
MEYIVYILESQKDNTFYIGYTSDIEKRLLYHNTGKSGYTSRKMPWKLIYSKHFPTKTEALRYEKFLKKQRNREFYLRLISNNNGPG